MKLSTMCFAFILTAGILLTPHSISAPTLQPEAKIPTIMIDKDTYFKLQQIDYSDSTPENGKITIISESPVGKELLKALGKSYMEGGSIVCYVTTKESAEAGKEKLQVTIQPADHGD